MNQRLTDAGIFLLVILLLGCISLFIYLNIKREGMEPLDSPFSKDQRGWQAGSPDKPMKETANLCNPQVLFPITQPNVNYGSDVMKCNNNCSLYIEAP